MNQVSFPNHEVVKIKLPTSYLDFGGFGDCFKPQLCQELVCIGAMAYDTEGLEVGRAIPTTAFSRYDVVHLRKPGWDIGQRLIALLAMGPITFQDAPAYLPPSPCLQSQRHILMGQVLATASIAPFDILIKSLLDFDRDKASFEVQKGGMSPSASATPSNE